MLELLCMSMWQEGLAAVACLQQQLCGRKDWQPLGFFTNKLEDSQLKYSAFASKRLFTCYSGIMQAETSPKCWMVAILP
jgi:hypothetical protein